MLFVVFLLCILSWVPCSTKVTYFNLETTYGPYCNARHTFVPDAGIVRYAGTPWIGKCELNLQSSMASKLANFSGIGNRSVSTRFYIYVTKAPLCHSENVTIQSEFGETAFIDCKTNDGSEFFFDAETLSIVYFRTEKFPLSNFSMIVTPLKFKSRMFTTCGFDCFTDLYCIDRSLVCDRYRNCPNHIDEASCDYQTQRKPLSLRSKIILMIILSLMISFDVISILVCYFCCGISERNRFDLMDKKRKPTQLSMEEGAATRTPLLEPKDTNECH